MRRGVVLTGHILPEVRHTVIIETTDANGEALVQTTHRNKKQLAWHPLQWIAQFDLVNQKDPEQKLTLSLLCQWLAEKANLPFYVIDPLKADVPALTEVMSQEFAIRNHILAVEVNDAEVLIGTDQPFLTDWVGYLENGLKPKKIQMTKKN